MPDVVLDTGVNTSGIASGMAQLRGHVKAVESEVSGTFARMFAAGSVVAFVRHLFETGEQLDDLSRKFAVSATVLQQWGQAAELNGGSLEGVAGALNKLEIARSKALGGNDGLVQSFGSLNVSLEDLQKLSPDELLRKVGSSSMDAADLVKVLGKSALTLRPLLQGVADGSIALGKAMDDGTIHALGEANKTFKELGQTITIFGGQTLGWLVKGWQQGVASMVAVMLAGRELIVGDLAAIQKALHFDFAGAVREIKAGGNAAGDQILAGVAVNRDIRNGTLNTPGESARGVGAAGGAGSTETDDNGNAVAGRSGSGSGAASNTNLYEQLAKIERDRYLDSLKKEQQLETIDRERAALQGYLNEGKKAGTLTDEEAAQTQLQIYDRDVQIHKIRVEMIDANKKWNDQENQRSEAAAAHLEQQQAELAAAREQTAELRETLAGNTEAAAEMRTQFEYQQKINAARKDGNEGLAKELETQRDLTLQAQQQAAAQKAIAAAQAASAANLKRWDDGMQKFADSASSYSPLDLLKIAYANAPDQRGYNDAPGGGPTMQEQIDRGYFGQHTQTPFPADYNPGFAQSPYRQRIAVASKQDILDEINRLMAAPRLSVPGGRAGGGGNALGGGSNAGDAGSQVTSLLQRSLDQLIDLNSAVKPKPGGG